MRISFAVLLKVLSPLIVIAFFTARTPFVSQAIFVILIFSSGSSTFPDKKILPSKTSDWTVKKYFLSVKANLADKFFCIIVSSICIPIVRGSKVISTPAPNLLTDVQDVKIKINKILIIFFIFYF